MNQFILPRLPYEYDSLAPFISADIQHLHHTKHHQTYVDNLNKALTNYPAWQEKSIEDIIVSLDKLPPDIKTVVRNNGGGHINHSYFWKMMAPAKNQKPQPQLLDKIQDAFGTFADFKKQFSEQAIKIFGSGWQWLVYTPDGLELLSTPNQDSPLSQGKIPLLGLDVWEHAYYLQYYNKRPDYIEAWWHVVNWENVAERLSEAQ